jgi:tellurite resistance protein
MKIPIISTRFEHISDEEYSELVDGVSWITLLIAGADGSIDDSEIEWAEKLANIRSYSTLERLNSFYEDVDLHFVDRVKSHMPELPKDTAERTEYITKKIEPLNPILKKLNPSTGELLYKSFLSFAEHVAKADGGFLRFFSVSKEEKKLLQLPMLRRIDHIDDDFD